MVRWASWGGEALSRLLWFLAEVGIWLDWRESEDFQWVSKRGDALPQGPGPRQSAFVVTKLQDADDDVVVCRRRVWLTLEECVRNSLRFDHLRLLRRLVRRLGNQASGCWVTERYQAKARRF